MGTVERYDVMVPFTEEQFEAAYVMWKSGAILSQLAFELDSSAAQLGWCFVMRSADKLGEYTVHFGYPNSSTI